VLSFSMRFTHGYLRCSLLGELFENEDGHNPVVPASIFHCDLYGEDDVN